MRLFAPLLLTLAATLSAAEPALRIGTITIRNLDVYSDDEAAVGGFYRAADRLHFNTKQSVIEQYLLFREGDVYRPERLAETERNLRALRFLKSASVVASEPHDGVVDVTVNTQDAWSIAPETQAGSKGGESTYGIDLSDTNVFGYGKEAEVGWEKGIDRTNTFLEYRDHAFFAPYQDAILTYGRASDGYNHRAIFRRPFYSFATPWSAELSFATMLRDDKLYSDAVLSEQFRQKHREVVAAYGRALGPNDEQARRITFGLRAVDDDFRNVTSRPGDALPSMREFRYLFVRFENVENDFLKLNFVNKDLRYEDFNLGRRYSAEAAISPRALGVAGNTGLVRFSGADGVRLGESGFVMPAVSLESRLGGGARNAIASASMSFVRRTDGAHPRALVGRVLAVSGWRVDREVQFFADGLTGLRGYRVHAFAGDRAFVVNLEQRVYLGRELLQLASPGIVAFIDAGNATDGGLSQLFRLKADAGAGIRIGLPRTPKNLIRIDVAYPLMRDPLGRKGVLVSFSSGQAF